MGWKNGLVSKWEGSNRRACTRPRRRNSLNTRIWPSLPHSPHSPPLTPQPPNPPPPTSHPPTPQPPTPHLPPPKPPTPHPRFSLTAALGLAFQVGRGGFSTGNRLNPPVTNRHGCTPVKLGPTDCHLPKQNCCPSAVRGFSSPSESRLNSSWASLGCVLTLFVVSPISCPRGGFGMCAGRRLCLSEAYSSPTCTDYTVADGAVEYGGGRGQGTWAGQIKEAKIYAKARGPRSREERSRDFKGGGLEGGLLACCKHSLREFLDFKLFGVKTLWTQRQRERERSSLERPF